MLVSYRKASPVASSDVLSVKNGRWLQVSPTLLALFQMTLTRWLCADGKIPCALFEILEMDEI